MKRYAWSLAAILAAVPFYLIAAEPEPETYQYKWRIRTGKTHVLWIGGGHWHDTLETASIMRRVLENSGLYHVTYSDDTASLNRLVDYDIVLINGMLDSFEASAERSLIESVNQGKPLLVLHAASACFRQPPPSKSGNPPEQHADFYQMLGGYVARHDPFGSFDVRIVDPLHPITKTIENFTIEDELFQFRDMQPDNHTLMVADSGGMTRPLAWTRLWGQGRVFHLSLGHDANAANHPVFQQLILNGLDWLAHERESNDVGATR